MFECGGNGECLCDGEIYGCVYVDIVCGYFFYGGDIGFGGGGFDGDVGCECGEFGGLCDYEVFVWVEFGIYLYGKKIFCVVGGVEDWLEFFCGGDVECCDEFLSEIIFCCCGEFGYELFKKW